MGLLNNIIACYILAFALICHGSLLLCIQQQINKQNADPVLDKALQDSIILDSSSQYNCPQFPDQVVSYTKFLMDKIPVQMIESYLEIYRMVGTDTVNYLIWFGTIALLGDIILLMQKQNEKLLLEFIIFRYSVYLFLQKSQYTILKPVKLLKSIVGALIRLAIIAFIALFVQNYKLYVFINLNQIFTLIRVYCLSEQGILPKYQFLEDLDFLQFNNLYQIMESSSKLTIKKIKQLLKKYM